ncbi:MAG: hypothetical protein P8X47_09600 [Ignavibacteriaceae bacterium]
MKKTIIISLVVVVALVYFFYPEKVITYPPGITVPEQPKQNNLINPKSWNVGEFTIQALAEYNIKARVLSRNNFSLGEESNLSPFDLALGWGPMSDQSVIDKIDISQSNRWYPKNEQIEEKFDNVYTGSLIEMKGYLVKVTKEDGWHWISSLKRDDTGGGSCELFWVEELSLMNK